MPTVRAPRRGATLLPLVCCLGFVYLTSVLPSAFMSPSSLKQNGMSSATTGRVAVGGDFVVGTQALRWIPERARVHEGRTTLEVGVGEKVLAAMSAGFVASVVSAMFGAVTEPIMNRVLVKRMSLKTAISEMTPALVLGFFMTTLSTNLIKFPLFEAVSMFLSLLPNMSSVVKGLVVGFIFTTATLPITNFRYRMSLQTPMKEALNPKLLYQAYPATVVRDMVYAVGRNILTALFLLKFATLSPSSPALMFPVVIGACVLSAPFNEVRGYLLQSGANKLAFKDFFKVSSFVRSTSLGAVNMGLSVSIGYFLTPIVGRAVGGLRAALEAGSLSALIGLVLVINGLGLMAANAFSKNVFSRAIDAEKGNIAKNEESIAEIVKRMESLEAANKKLADKVVSLGGSAAKP